MSTVVMEANVSFYPGASRSQTRMSSPSCGDQARAAPLSSAASSSPTLSTVVIAQLDLGRLEAAIVGVDLDEPPILAARAERQHQQRVEAEPLEQRCLGRVGRRVVAEHDARLAAVDHFLRERVIGDEEQLQRGRIARAVEVAQLDEQVADDPRNGATRRVEHRGELRARHVQQPGHRCLGADLLERAIDVGGGHRRPVCPRTCVSTPLPECTRISVMSS